MGTKNGFTLIELLVVVGILAIAASGIFLSFQTALQNQRLQVASQQMVDTINQAKTFSRSFKDEAQWGVRNTSKTQYELFANFATGPSQSKSSYTLPQGSSFSENFSIQFTKSSGTLTAPVDIKIENSRIKKVIHVLISGAVDIETL